MTNEEQSGNIEDEKRIWRVIDPASYAELRSFSVSGMTVDRQESATPVIASVSPANSTWAAAEDFLYTTDSTIIAIDNDKHTIKGLASGTATVTATHKSSICSATFTVKVNKNAIIIIPGIMGSELIAGPNNKKFAPGTNLWSASMLELVNQGELLTAYNLVSDLKCDTSGNSIDDVIINPNSPYGMNDTYQSLYNSLYTTYASQYEIRFFGYDWRLSNSISASKLNAFINSNEYDKVVLVAHSMGGLVASKYISIGNTQRNKIEAVIMLGAPLLGTPAAVYVWGSNIADWPLPIPEYLKNLLSTLFSSYNVGDELYCNFPSLYELFPTEKYFDSEWANQNYLITSYAGISELSITTYTETKSRLGSYLAHFNMELMNNAEVFHNSLYLNSQHITNLVNSYYVAGVNYQETDVGYTTIEKIHYDLLDWSIYSRTAHGDELVPVWSADLSNKYASKTFYANNIYHTWLVSNTNVKNFILQLISGNSSSESFNNILSNYSY